MATEAGDGLTFFMALSGPLMATANTSNPLETLPLTAGITGATISVWIGKQAGELPTRSQAGLSFVCGVAAAFFIAPVFVDHLVGGVIRNPDISVRMFVYLLTGLLGSTLIFKFWEMRQQGARMALKKLRIAEWLNDSKVVDLKDVRPDGTKRDGMPGTDIVSHNVTTIITEVPEITPLDSPGMEKPRIPTKSTKLMSDEDTEDYAKLPVPVEAMPVVIPVNITVDLPK